MISSLRVGLLVLIAVCGPVSTASAEMIYLAVGDSSAFGETNRTQNPSNGDRGYVKPFADYLGTLNGGVRPGVRNLAVNGETTKSFFTGLISDRASTDGITLNSRYAPFAPNYPSQRNFMLSTIQSELAAGNQIKTVTVQLGANDISNVAEAPGFLNLTAAQQQQQILQSLGAIQANYVTILGTIRALLPNADLLVIGYHNPYGGSPFHPFYNLAAPAVQGLNQVIEGVGTNPAFGAKYVDFYTPILGRDQELTLINTFPADLVNYVHLNSNGYGVVSQQLIRTAAVPVPPSVILFGMGALGLLGIRRYRVA